MPNGIRIQLLACVLVLLAGCGAPTSKPEPAARAGLETPDMTRGGDLYRTHCIACHTAQVHWRDKSMVHSWGDLRYQVARWQKNAGQDWSAQEIEDVAAYLNRLFYQVPCPSTGCGGPSAAGSADRLARAR
jgi:hypothetical protein